jgi:hypothetical protein
MTDGQALLLVLVLLYLSECLIWVKKQSVAFVLSTGRRGRIALPKSWLGNANGGMLLLSPLPPPGRVFLSHLLPISISPAGVCAFNSQTLPWGARASTQSGRFVSFEEIAASTTDGVYVLVNGEKFAKCATSTQAKALANVIVTAKAAKSSRREAIIRSWIAKQFAASEAKHTWRETEEIIGPVRDLCSISLLFLFVVAPVLVSVFGLQRLIIPVAAVMVALAVLIAIVFYRAHRALYAAEGQERFENVVKMILCPPVSLRAADLLTRNLLSQYSPIVLAGIFGGSGERSASDEEQFVRAFVLDLQHPLRHEVSDQDALETISWMSAAQLKASLEHFERGGYSLPGPTEREGESISYCPRCGCQFVIASGDCPDCPGVALVAF